MTYEHYVQSVLERDWGLLCKNLDRSVVGSEAFVALVQQRRYGVVRRGTPAASFTPPRALREPTRPAPQPSGSPRKTSVALTASLGMAFLALCAAGLFGKNAASLRQALRAVAKERQLSPWSSTAANATTVARLAAVASLDLGTEPTLPSHLNGTLWEVEVHPITGIDSASTQTDHLEFRNGKVTSQQLVAQGFSPSNYTLTLQHDGTIVWGTMQTSKAGTVVCWRGEWRGQMMRGILTRQVPGQPVRNFSFVGAAQPQHDVGQTTSEI